jgi:hypothetical protein
MAPKQGKPQATTVIGWQGYTVRVPDDWTIGAIGGDHLEGYLRIDGTDMPRCEIKWFGERGPVNISEVIDKYLTDLQKKRRRRSPEVKVKRDTRLLGRRRGGRSQLECFAWESETKAHGAAWQCRKCGRTTIVQVLGHLDEDLDTFATDIMLSITDHPHDGWVTWSTYGLHCEIPEDFHLAGQKLMAGLIELTFRMESEEISVMRWGMADVALSNESLEEWSKRELSNRLKQWSATYEGTEFKGHPAIVVVGEPSPLPARVRTFVSHCLRRPYGSNTKALVWHCEDEKKIYYVECIVDDSRLDLPDEVCDRIPCHQQVEA